MAEMESESDLENLTLETLGGVDLTTDIATQSELISALNDLSNDIDNSFVHLSGGDTLSSDIGVLLSVSYIRNLDYMFSFNGDGYYEGLDALGVLRVASDPGSATSENFLPSLIRNGFDYYDGPVNDFVVNKDSYNYDYNFTHVEWDSDYFYYLGLDNYENPLSVIATIPFGFALTSFYWPEIRFAFPIGESSVEEIRSIVDSQDWTRLIEEIIENEEDESSAAIRNAIEFTIKMQRKREDASVEVKIVGYDAFNEYMRETYFKGYGETTIATYIDSYVHRTDFNAKTNEAFGLIDQNASNIRNLETKLQKTTVSANAIIDWKNQYGSLSAFTINSGTNLASGRVIVGEDNKFFIRNTDAPLSDNAFREIDFAHDRNKKPFMVFGKGNTISTDYVGFGANADLKDIGGGDGNKKYYTDILIGNNLSVYESEISSGYSRYARSGNIVIHTNAPGIQSFWNNKYGYAKIANAIIVNGVVAKPVTQTLPVIDGIAIGSSAAVKANGGIAIGSNSDNPKNFATTQTSYYNNTTAGYRSIAIGNGASTCLNRYRGGDEEISGVNSNIAIGAGIPRTIYNIAEKTMPGKTAAVAHRRHGSIVIAVSQIPDELLSASLDEISNDVYLISSIPSFIDGNYSVGLGSGIELSGDASIGIGKSNTVSFFGRGSFPLSALSAFSSSDLKNNVIVGNSNKLQTNKFNNIIIGSENTSDRGYGLANSINIGSKNLIEVTTNNELSCYEDKDYHETCIVLGCNNKETIRRNAGKDIIIGYDNRLNNAQNLSLRRDDSLNRIVIGLSSQIGTTQNAPHDSIALGTNVKNNSNNAVAVGNSALIHGGCDDSIAIGLSAQVTNSANSAIQLGTGINTNEKTLQIFEYPLLLSTGYIPEDRLERINTLSSIVIGNKARISDSSSGIAIGQNSVVKDNSKYGIAIGYGEAGAPEGTSVSGQSSIALGYGAKVSATAAVQIGNGTNNENYSFKFRDTTIVSGNGIIPETSIDPTIARLSAIPTDYISKEVVRNAISNSLTGYNQEFLSNDNISHLTIKDIISSMNSIFYTLSALSVAVSN